MKICLFRPLSDLLALVATISWLTTKSKHPYVFGVIGRPMNLGFLAIYAFSNCVITLRNFCSDIGLHFKCNDFLVHK